MRQRVATIVLALLPVLGGCQTDVIVGERELDACVLDTDTPDACAVDADADGSALDADPDDADARQGR